jgi:cytochrome b6-f complex iron-sulfur subunit
MSTTAAIIVAVAAIVVFAAIGFTMLARRTDVRGAGALSAETVHRDADARKARAAATAAAEAEGAAARTAAVAEAEGVEARTGTSLAPVSDDTGLTPWTPPDPEAIGVSRRQFFNRASISLMGASIGT